MCPRFVTCSVLGMAIVVVMHLLFDLGGSGTLEEVSLGEEHSEETLPYPS